MTISVSIMDGTLQGRTYSFDAAAEFVVGRHPDCSCCLENDPMVSRRHAMLVVSPPEVTLKDLNSTNGFFVNGKKYGGLESPLLESLQLKDGDVVQVGKTRMRLSIATADGASSVANVSVAPARNTEYLAKEEGAPDLSGAFPRIAGYELSKVIGSGGMGSVYKATRTSDGEVVAIKVLSHADAGNTWFLESFRREIEITKSIQHSNIVKFFDAGLTDDQFLYLAIEYVNGGDLEHYIDMAPRKRLGLPDAFGILLQIAEGMRHVHERNLVHRDIKPSNILLHNFRRKRTIKISDLGLAKNFERAGLSGFTSSSISSGTMEYMPPEQMTGFRDVKPSADVFSMAATFYDMVTGRSPYNFLRDDDDNRMMKIVADGEMTPIAEAVYQMPKKLSGAIDKALSRDPLDRYQNAGEMLEALRDIKVQ